MSSVTARPNPEDAPVTRNGQRCLALKVSHLLNHTFASDDDMVETSGLDMKDANGRDMVDIHSRDMVDISCLDMVAINISSLEE
jgi:hypothetical protein